MYTYKLVFICCISWCHGATVSIEDRTTRECSSNVNLRNGTSTTDERPWTVQLKLPENLEVTVTKQDTAENKKDFGYYNLHTSPATWFGAKLICEQEGAHLLVLNSEREFSTVKAVWDTYPKLLTGAHNNYLHIGLHDHFEEGKFITLDGQPVSATGYAKWASNEPNSGVGANCMAVSREGLYYDSFCNDLFAFFCEM